MKKDILTREKIKFDSKKQFLYSVKSLILLPFIFIPLILFVLYVYLNLEKDSILLIAIILVTLIQAFLAYICVFGILDSYKKYKTIKKGSFKIVTDKVIDVQEEATYVGSAFMASFSRPYALIFSSYGKYAFDGNEYYTWSELYSMSTKSVFNYSGVGDIFYLVIDKNEKIISIYNTRLFELTN
ncbi:MAG: hypothetical protein IKV81_01335 [Clostridia bacterium]|nr:hypothetical protein [Clostridia bacterium]